MIVHIPKVLSPEELKSILDQLRAEDYVDGRATLVQGRDSLKHNLELPLNSDVAKRLGAMITTALRRHPLFVHLVMPRRVSSFLFNRYQSGMSYGDHFDTVLQALGSDHVLRADVSITVFLSDPASYDGGELIIESDTNPKPVKLPAGDAVAYPATTTHRVENVSRGVRLAAVAWIQSIMPDPARRQVIADLLIAKDLMGPDGSSPAPAALDEARRRTFKAYMNLLQFWSEV
jgi:PKHD-type hydroxylase